MHTDINTKHTTIKWVGVLHWGCTKSLETCNWKLQSIDFAYADARKISRHGTICFSACVLTRTNMTVIATLW